MTSRQWPISALPPLGVFGTNISISPSISLFPAMKREKSPSQPDFSLSRQEGRKEANVEQVAHGGASDSYHLEHRSMSSYFNETGREALQRFCRGFVKLERFTRPGNILSAKQCSPRTHFHAEQIKVRLWGRRYPCLAGRYFENCRSLAESGHGRRRTN